MSSSLGLAAAAPRRAGLLPSDRLVLALATIAALALAAAMPATSPERSVDADLVLVIRAMAVIKGGMAALAVVACLWRLARPAAGWRRFAYGAGPPVMAAGAIALWRLEMLGIAALGLHVALFGVVAAALTDADFVAWRAAAPSWAKRIPRGGPKLSSWPWAPRAPRDR